MRKGTGRDYWGIRRVGLAVVLLATVACARSQKDELGRLGALEVTLTESNAANLKKREVVVVPVDLQDEKVLVWGPLDKKMARLSPGAYVVFERLIKSERIGQRIREDVWLKKWIRPRLKRDGVFTLGSARRIEVHAGEATRIEIQAPPVFDVVVPTPWWKDVDVGSFQATLFPSTEDDRIPLCRNYLNFPITSTKTRFRNMRPGRYFIRVGVCGGEVGLGDVRISQTGTVVSVDGASPDEFFRVDGALRVRYRVSRDVRSEVMLRGTHFGTDKNGIGGDQSLYFDGMKFPEKVSEIPKPRGRLAWVSVYTSHGVVAADVPPAFDAKRSRLEVRIPVPGAIRVRKADRFDRLFARQVFPRDRQPRLHDHYRFDAKGAIWLIPGRFRIYANEWKDEKLLGEVVVRSGETSELVPEPPEESSAPRR